MIQIPCCRHAFGLPTAVGVLLAALLLTIAPVAKAQESSPSGHFLFNTLGLGGTGANSFVDKGAGDDMLPYTSDDVTLPALGNLGGTWSLAHMDVNSDNKVQETEHIFTIIRRDDDDTQEFSAMSRPEYGVLYESEDWWDYHDARNEGLSKDVPYDPADPAPWLDAAGGDFEHNDDNGWCGESNAILYNNLRADQHGEGKSRYYFELINPSNTDQLPAAGWVYDEIEGWEKTFDVQQNYNDPNTEADERNGPGGCRRWNRTTKSVTRGYLIPVEDLAALQNGTLVSLFGWETVDLAQYFRETIAPKLEDPDLNIFPAFASELGLDPAGYLPPTHLMLLQVEVPLEPNGSGCGDNTDGARLTAESLFGVGATGTTYRVSHLLGFNADYVNEALASLNVRGWTDVPEDGATKNLWLLDHFFRDDTSHLGKYTFIPADPPWTIVDDPEFEVIDNTKDRILVSNGAGAFIAPLPRAILAGERPLDVIADLAEDATGDGVNKVQIGLHSDTGVVAYAEIGISDATLSLGGTFDAGTGAISGGSRSVTGTAVPQLGIIDAEQPLSEYTRFTVTVTTAGITISQRLDGDYAPNDFTDGGIGGTLLATLTFEGGEGVDSISKVSVYASAKFATSTIGVFAGLETIIVDGDTFIRSDSNCDGKLDISDAINTLNVLFLGTGSICCEAASDANSDGRTDLSDAVFSLNFLFQGGTGPQAPYPDCGGSGCPANDSCQ